MSCVCVGWCSDSCCSSYLSVSGTCLVTRTIICSSRHTWQYLAYGWVIVTIVTVICSVLAFSQLRRIKGTVHAEMKICHHVFTLKSVYLKNDFLCTYDETRGPCWFSSLLKHSSAYLQSSFGHVDNLEACFKYDTVHCIGLIHLFFFPKKIFCKHIW